MRMYPSIEKKNFLKVENITVISAVFLLLFFFVKISLLVFEAGDLDLNINFRDICLNWIYLNFL